MTIRRGGSPREPGRDPQPPSPAPPPPAVSSSPSEPPTVPELLRQGGSVRGGGPPRGAGPVPAAPSPQPVADPVPVEPTRTAPAAAGRGRGPVPPRGPALRLPRELPSIPLLGGAIGPGLSVVGLVIVAAVSYALLTGNLPFLPGNGGDGGPIRTPTPSNVVVVDPRANVHGTLVYVKGGNLWLQSGATATQLTDSGRDAMPTWSADGSWIYFVRTAPARGRWPAAEGVREFDLEMPTVIRIHPDGAGLQRIFTGRVQSGSYTWAAFVRQPVPSPNDSRVALVTDYPDPSNSDIVLKLLNVRTGGVTSLGLPEVVPLGHQDPAWSPDGKTILYVKDARVGTRGAPVIERYDLDTKKLRALTGPGYIAPAWSPDGRYVAATRTGSFGTNVVILDARNGHEVLRLTSDESSFAPTWSSAGDAIAYLHVDRGVVDLRLVTLSGTAGSWTPGEAIDLTVSAGLDATSRPSWFIPAAELPTPGPTVEASVQAFPTLHGSPAP